MRPFALTPGAWLVADGLAVFRLTVLVTQDTITDKIRQRIKRRFGDTAYDFVTCPWCVSIWVAAGVVTAHRVAPRLWAYPAVGLAASGVTGFLAERI